MRWTTLNFDGRLPPRMGGMYRLLTGRSAWPLSAGLLAAGAVVVLPMLAVLLVGAVVGGVVFMLASLVEKVRTGLGGNGSAAAGSVEQPAEPRRENVRVLRR